MCDFSPCKLNGMPWNFSRSIFRHDQTVVSVALLIRVCECGTTGSQVSWFVICMIMIDEWSSSWLSEILRIKESMWDEEVCVSSSINPFHRPSPSLFYSADWFIGAHWGAKTSVSLLALWWTTQTKSHTQQTLFRGWCTLGFGFMVFREGEEGESCTVG